MSKYFLLTWNYLPCVSHFSIVATKIKAIPILFLFTTTVATTPPKNSQEGDEKKTESCGISGNISE